MAICSFCSKPAGPLRLKHPECRERARAGWSSLVEAAAGRLYDGELDSLPEEVERIADAGLVPPKRVRTALLRAWRSTARALLKAENLTEEWEARLLWFAQLFGLERRELDKSGLLTRLVKAAVLRDLELGMVPAPCELAGPLSLNLQRGETLVWVFERARYYEETTTREYRGRGSGFSLRIVGGLWWRGGRYRGRAVESRRKIKVDSGLLGITDESLYFSGKRGSFRLPFSAIVAMRGLRSGIRVDCGGRFQGPMFFKVRDARFLQEMLRMLTDA